MKQPRTKRRRSAGCLTLLIVIAAIWLLDGPVSAAIDMPFNPWAHSWRGGPTLTGTWVGTATSPSGKQIGLLLDMQRARSSRGRYSSCANCPRIEGTAQQCGGADQAYEVWGGPDTWSGSQFHLNQRPIDPQVAELQLGYIHGEWAGDSLRVSMTLESRTNEVDDQRDITEPISASLTRGDAASFQAVCEGIANR